MAEFLGNAPAGQLLCLTAAPLLGAVLLVGLLLFRRNPQDDLKLGSSFKRSQSPLPPPTEDEEEGDDLDISVLSNFGTAAKPAPLKAASAPPPPPPAPPPPPVQVETRPLPPAEPLELLRLWRDPETGQLIVGVGEQRYNKLSDIPNKQTGQYIFELVGHLLAFTNGMVATSAGLKSLGIPKMSALPMPLPKAEPKIAPVPPVPPVPVAPPPPAPKPVLTAPPKRTPPLAADTSLLGGFDLAAQINEIVQRRLLLSPLGQTTAIDVATAPEGGIRITVNGLIYGTADEVPDMQARTLIKDSIREWERS